jgi:predicted RNA-binding Zn-ribbon protein involved in translation (DUF1610 family)
VIVSTHDIWRQNGLNGFGLGCTITAMDTAFNCDKCGQHIVIDEAGAGMTVPCPSCNQNLTVPTKGADFKKPALTDNLE